MPKDPVCVNYVSKDTPYKQELEGTTYYFCSAECVAEFQENYEDYLEVEEEMRHIGE